MTNGNLHIDAADGKDLHLNYYEGSTVSFGSGANGVVAVMGSDGDLWKGSADNSGSKYWHAGNDGSGSGLDADTVDGIQASSFLRSDAADSTSSTISFTGNIEVGDQILHAGDTDTYMQFYALDGWRVVTGAQEKIRATTHGVGIGDVQAGSTFGNGKALAIGDSDTGIRPDGDRDWETRQPSNA